MSTETYESMLQVQDTIAGYIQAIDLLHGKEVITERTGDLNQRIQTALTKLGLSIVVITPGAQLVRSLGNQRFVFKVRIVIDISENALLARSKAGATPALAAALAIAAGIVGKPNGLTSGVRPLSGESFEINLETENAITLVPDNKSLIYHVNAWTHLFITIPA